MKNKMEQKDNIKYILLDIWETLLFSNENEKNINYDRARIICKATNYGNVGFWKDKIEDEILGDIAWNKTEETYLQDEKVWQVSYFFEIN